MERSLALAALLMCGAVTVSGQTTSTGSGQAYPLKPVRVVTSEAGGGSDLVVRVLANRLAAGVEQPVIVDNRGGGVIAGAVVAKADPDGYTLLYYGSTLWILPLLRKEVPYDVLRDFAPVTQGTSSSNILVVHQSLPVKSVRELIALARRSPGQLNYASAASGTANHLAAAIFVSAAGVNIVRIPYKGTASALNALVSGEVALMFSGPGPAAPHVKSGRLRALGVTSAEPWPTRPELPTIAQAGLPGYYSVTMTGIFAPARTPAAIITRLNQELARVLVSPELKDVLADGVAAVGGPPEQLAAAIKSEMVRVGKLLKDAGIRDEQ